MRTSLLSSIALLLLVACSNSVMPTANTTMANDHTMISLAYQSSTYAMKIAEEGSARSAAYETKQLAEKSVQNHKAIITLLSEFAGVKGIALPADIKVEEVKQWKEMVAQKGSLFDRSFIELSDKQNNYVLEVFDYMSKRAKDADIRRTAKYILAYTANPQDGTLEKQVSITNKSSSATPIKTNAFIPQ